MSVRSLFRRLFRSSPRTVRRPNPADRVRLSLQHLEDRANPSSYEDGYGNLVITGTDAADSVVVRYEPARNYGGYWTAPMLKVYEHGVHTGSHVAWGISKIHFHGYGGNDYFDNYANDWGVVAYGGAGNDTLVGYGQADWLEGGTEDDYLYGYGGNDTLVGQNGNDRLYGMDGNDYLIGCWNGWAGESGGANDTIDGGSGNDSLYAGDGDDALYGGANDDFLIGENGADRLSGDGGYDTLQGGTWGNTDTAGNTLDGGTENDRLIGGSLNDTLRGGDGSDQLEGMDGDDWMEAGAAWESAVGGNGTDWNAHVWAVGGAWAGDIDQERSPTCGFLSSLAAVSRYVSLDARISYQGNYTYGVQLYDPGLGRWVTESVRFDGTMVANSAGTLADPRSTTEGEFWTILFQRAYLQRSYGINVSNYDQVIDFNNNGNLNDGEWPDRPMQWLTGQTAAQVGTGAIDPWTLWNLTWSRGVVACDSVHCYTVRDVWQDAAGGWHVVLYNPWREDRTHEAGLTFTADGSNDGFITVDWDVFRNNLTRVYSVAT